MPWLSCLQSFLQYPREQVLLQFALKKSKGQKKLLALPIRITTNGTTIWEILPWIESWKGTQAGSNSVMSLLWNGIPKDLFIEQTLTSTLLQLSNWEHFDVFSNLSIHSSYFSSRCCYEDTLALEICYLTLPNAYLSKDRKTFTDWQSRWALCTTIRTCVLSDRQIREIRSETSLDVRPCTMQVLTCIRFRDLFYALPKAFLKERCCLFCYKRSKGKIYASTFNLQLEF